MIGHSIQQQIDTIDPMSWSNSTIQCALRLPVLEAYRAVAAQPKCNRLRLTYINYQIPVSPQVHLCGTGRVNLYK